MKYRLFSQQGRMATLFIMLFLPVVLMAQEGDYTVRITAPVKVDTLPGELRKCPGISISFMAEGLNTDGSAFDPGQVTFTWDFGYKGQSQPGSSPTFTYPEGGHYTIRLYVTGINGKPSAKNVPVIEAFIGMRPSFAGTRSDQTSICSGNEIGLTGFVTSIPWTKDSFQFENTYAQSDFTWNGAGKQSDRNGIARIKPPLDGGDQNYLFRIKDNFGCYHDTTLTLFGVHASFIVSPKSGEAPLELTMKTVSSSNGGDTTLMTYDYEFYINADTLKTTETKFTLERPGDYSSRMISKYLQCTNIFSSDFYIRVDSSLLEIPNVFTPNEDGANDYFQVKALSLKSFSGRIMNRWGRVVYEWTDPKTLEKGWNGKYMNDGQPAPSGTYYYIISATGYDDKPYKGKINDKMYYGFLTLIR